MMTFIILTMVSLLIGLYLGILVRLIEHGLQTSKALGIALAVFFTPLISLVLIANQLSDKKLEEKVQRSIKKSGQVLTERETAKILKEITSFKVKSKIYLNSIRLFWNLREMTEHAIELFDSEIQGRPKKAGCVYIRKEEVQTYNKSLIFNESNRTIKSLIDSRISY